MDQLRAMRTFACVAEHGSFTRAARTMSLAPSIVTRLVAELEQQLDARLLTRTTRRVALTQIGQRYLERVRGILRDVDDATALVSDSQRRMRGRVRLIAPPEFAERQLMPRLPALHARHPEITVHVTAGSPVDTLHEAYDISIVVRSTPLDGDFVAHPLATSKMVLCASPEYLRRSGAPQHPLDLTTHALLVAAPEGAPRRLTLTRSAANDGRPGETSVDLAPERIVLSTPNAWLCHSAALAGLGIAALPSFAVDAELQQRRLIRVLDGWSLKELTIHACLPSRRQVPAVVRAMLDFLKSEFPGAGRDPWLPADAPSLPHLRLAA
jgi:DNA-binding transcriptional LysR family regulator